MTVKAFLRPVRRFLNQPSVALATERARQLAEAGQFRAAMDLLANERADLLDLATLRELVKWRSAAFDPGVPRADWPPQLADPYPEVHGVPEIHRSELTADVLGGAILHHGSLLVRGLITENQTANLAAIVNRSIDAAQRPEPEISPWFAPFPSPEGITLDGSRKFVMDQSSLWTVDSPRALADLVAFLKAHGILGVIEEYLGERAFLSVTKSTLRRVQPDTWAGWHQDGAFLGANIRTVNCWLALSDCGNDAPGLDIYPRRLDGVVETGTRGAPFSWAVGDGFVDDLAAATTPIASPLFKAGDALMFDQLLLHRTGARPNLKRPRLAIESWLFAGSTFPMKEIPIAL